jgi:hypothetical protein
MTTSLTSTAKILITTFFILLFPATTFPTILTVKQDGTGDFTKIQEAYLAASSGDTVLVFPGTYYENIHINHPIDITVGSLFLSTQDRSYIKNTIINGNQSGSCVFIDGTNEKEIKLIGFTLTNGSGHGEGLRGGGIFVDEALQVTIQSNIIRNNKADVGGGIMVISSEIFISDNIIKENSARNGGGGIMNLYESQIAFDPENKNSVFMNFAPVAMDIGKISYSGPMDILLDTCTVLEPDYYFIYSYDLLNFPNNDITISVDNGKIEPVASDLYVNPETGDDQNDGLTAETALKTIAWACTKIASDSSNPLNIYLMDGVYSTASNQQKFPFNGRSYVSLIGESKENTIFEGDSSYFFYFSSGVQQGFKITNLTLQNTYEDDKWKMRCGGMYFLACSDFSLSNLAFRNCQDNATSGMGFDYPDKLLLKNITFDSLQGGSVLEMGNSLLPEKTFKCENIAIRNFRPDDDPMVTGGEGDGIGFSGSLHNEGRFSGTVVNLQVTDGLRIPNPGWGPGTAVSLFVYKHANVNLINTTIGNNTCRGLTSFAANIDDGAVVNMYNTIMYHDSAWEISLGDPLNLSLYPATLNLSHNNIEGGEEWGAVNWHNQHTINWLEGNINQNPQWVGTGDTAYYLQDDSPCINAGTPMYEDGMEPPYIREEDGKYVLYMHNMDTVHLPATDLAGNPRISGGRIDMGAYEYQDTTTFVAEHPASRENVIDVVVYPNPFYVHSFVDFSLDEKSHIQIIITDLNGKIVNNFLDATLPKGNYKFTWKGDNDHGSSLKTGMYLLSIWKDGKMASTVKVVKDYY